MSAGKMDPIFTHFAAHYGIDVANLPRGNFSWGYEPPRGTTLFGIANDVPPFFHTSGKDGRWQFTVTFVQGDEEIKVVANSLVVVIQVKGRDVPATMITGGIGRPVTDIVAHPVLVGLEIEQIEAPGGGGFTILCYRERPEA